MRETRHYKVAEHVFCVEAETDDFAVMGNYEPFGCDDGETAFTLSVSEGEAVGYTQELRQEDEGQEIICGKTVEGKPIFEFRWQETTAGWLVCSDDYREGRLILAGRYRNLAIDNALMILFALATADKGTVLFHAAAVSYQGLCYLFLGKSGTGKSTHARLWLEHIRGTELVNDDNPVVRDGIVYGSPWSGKTPCYRNVRSPLGSIVLLSQAPYNKISLLSGIEAYAAILPSISGMRWDKRIAEGLHTSENKLASAIPAWHLECLPDEAAAKLCNKTITR